jgi:hypothetical protein
MPPTHIQSFRNRLRCLEDELKTMLRSLTVRGAILYAGLAFLIPVFFLHDHASAQSRFEADYVVSFARITVGNIAVTADIDSAAYAISASGRVGGAIRLLANGEGHLTTRGTITSDRPAPTNFVFKIDSTDDPVDIKMVIEDGNVTELAALPPSGDGVPINDAHRQGILDPLTAILIPAGDIGDGLTKEACERTLPVFDGRQRYDLKLAFKRLDKVTANKGYAGPVVVCSLSYRPIAGHRVSTPFIKYLSESREAEIAFAPVAGARLLAPFRLVVANLLANLSVQANRFEATMQASSNSNLSGP